MLHEPPLPPSDPLLSGPQIKHLEFIQATVARLGNNSFLIKGWAITLIAAFAGFSLSQDSWQIALAGVVPTAAFCVLDAYYLCQERRYRRLYDDVRLRTPGMVPFLMDPSGYAGQVRLRQTLMSPTVITFYGTVAVVDLALIVWNLARN